MSNKARVTTGFIILALIGVGYFVHSSGILTELFGESSKEAIAQSVVAACENEPYRPTCYEEKLFDLVTIMPTVEVFEVIRLVRTYDPEYLFCHVLAHDLGQYEVSLDPDNWLDVIATAPPDGLCSNGFTHGGVLARFNNEVLTGEKLQAVLPEFAIACEEREGWNPTNLLKAICYHGLGHVFIHITEANVDEALDACQTVALKEDGSDYRQVCTDGVYMQLFQPLEPEDYALIDQLPTQPTRENIAEFCAENSDTVMQQNTCWSEAWPLFYEDLFTKEGVFNYCGSIDNEEGKEKCFVSAFTINGRHNLGNPAKMSDFCNSLTPEYQGMCFARGANAFPEEDPSLMNEAVGMCERALETPAQNECFDFLATTATFNYHIGSPAHEAFCGVLPEEYEDQCLNY